MATVIVRLCDQHMAAGDEVPADNWNLTVTPPGERVKAFDVDLCPQCAKGLTDLIEHFEDVARKGAPPPAQAAAKRSAGRPPTADPNDPNTILCPDCGRAYNNRSALGGHARKIHGKGLSELFGETLHFQCMRCPEPYPKFGNGTGFAAHQRAVHDLPPGTPKLPGEDLRQDTLT